MFDTSKADLGGFGDNAIKIADRHTHEVIGYYGFVKGKEKLYIPSPISTSLLREVLEFVNDLRTPD